jgi:general secretion pathway protein H
MHGSRNAGFTLLELLLAVIIMGLALAVSYPSLSRGSSTFRLRAAARDVFNILRHAREKAVTEQAGMKVTIDREAQKLVLTDDLGDNAQTYAVSKGIKIQRIVQAGTEITDGPMVIRFLPNGSSDDGEILLKSTSGAFLQITADPITGGARIGSSAGENAP